MNKRTMKLIALIIWVIMLVNCIDGLLRSHIVITRWGAVSGIPLHSLALMWIRALSLLVCIIVLMLGKRRLILNVSAVLYIVGRLFSVSIDSALYGFSVSATLIIHIALFIIAYLLAWSVTGEKHILKDTESENAKIQKEKQVSIYEQQLKDGIITQDEYNQLVNKNK